MKVCLSDNNLHQQMAPLSLTRPIAELRFGIRTIRESWMALLDVAQGDVSYDTQAYLNGKYVSGSDDAIVIAGNVKPTVELADLVKQLKPDQKLQVNGVWIASGSSNASEVLDETSDNLLFFEKPWHLFQKADEAIRLDYDQLTAGRSSAFPSNTNQIIGADVFIEEGASVECSILNAETGPIYIGKDSQILEGSMIRGPFALGEGAVVKMGCKIYGATSLGPQCRAGGEISNSVFQGYSNKGHDGFVGNSVLGEWCNLGADTNTSNLKNNYSNVRFYSYDSKELENTDILFCGVIMGDHAKTGINTMLNTATSVGVSANIFNSGFPPKYVPSFAWGGFDGQKFILDKSFEVARNMMARRKIEFSQADMDILSHIYKELA